VSAAAAASNLAGPLYERRRVTFDIPWRESCRAGGNYDCASPLHERHRTYSRRREGIFGALASIPFPGTFSAGPRSGSALSILRLGAGQWPRRRFLRRIHYAAVEPWSRGAAAPLLPTLSFLIMQDDQ
jgi:hypothetical protein